VNLDGSAGPIWGFMADDTVNVKVLVAAGIGLGWRF
jgi:hypothetical protein